MSYITQYKSTIELNLKGKSNRVLIVDNDGYEKINNLFSQEELLSMNLLGLLKMEDNAILKATNLYDNEIMFFIGSNSISKLIKILEITKTHVYIFSYNFLSVEEINKIKQNDVKMRICKITHSLLDFYPISEKTVIGSDIFTVLKNKPVDIVYHRSGEKIKDDVKKKLETTIKNQIIDENTNNSLLYVIGREYDEITPLVTPWHYQSLINYFDIKIGSCGTDKFFSKHKFSLYNEVTNEFKNESNILTQKNKKQNNTKDKFELDEKTRVISHHIEICGKIQKYIEEQNILNKSLLEQKALIKTASSTELKELENVNNKLYELLIGNKSVILNGFINKLNFVGENLEKSMYHQYTLPLRTMIQNLRTMYNKYRKIYIYIEKYVCYEEIAEIHLINKTDGPQIYLLSDNIDGTIYPALTMNKYERTNECFKVLCDEIKHDDTMQANVYYDEIENQINFLTKHNYSFNEKDNEICQNIKSTLPTVLMKEFKRLKSEKPKNKLEKNINNIKLNKLSKLGTEFGKFEQRDRQIHDSMSSFNKKYNFSENNNDMKQSLLLKKNDEQELYDIQQEIDRREIEIDKIYENTIEVHALFVEVNALVAKQTLMLGNIEDNVINACELIESGNKELVKADKYQENSNKLSDGIIAGLFGLTVLLGIGVGIKESIMQHH